MLILVPPRSLLVLQIQRSDLKIEKFSVNDGLVPPLMIGKVPEIQPPNAASMLELAIVQNREVRELDLVIDLYRDYL